MAASADLVVRVVSETKDAVKGLGAVADKSKTMADKTSASAKLAGGVLLGLGAAAVTAGKAAAEDAQGQALLAKAMQNSVGATSAQIAATEDSISAMSAATGVADDELRPAYATLIRATGDTAKSQDALQQALDISAATGKDLGSVTDGIAKGFAGNTGALGKLVPGLSKAVVKSGDMNAIMKELARTTGGAAAASAETAAGKMQRFHVALQETKEGIGAALLPLMGKLASVMLTVATFAQEHATLFAVLAGVIGVVAAAIVVINAVTTIYTAVAAVAGVVSGAAWAAALWPILLVIAAIAIVIVIVVLLWKKCETFRTIVLAVWSAIQTAALAAWNWIRSAFTGMIAGLSAMVRGFLLVVVAVWNAIRAAAGAVFGWLRSAWASVTGFLRSAAASASSGISAAFNAVRSAVAAVANWVRSVWATTFGALRSAASGISSALSAPFHIIESAIHGVIGAVQTLIGWLSRIKVPSIKLPSIPGLGKSVPAARYTPVSMPGAGSRSAPGRSAPAAPASIVINISGPTDPEGAARAIKRVLERHDQRVGLTGVLRTS